VGSSSHVFSNREWGLPWLEILRLASGFSLPLLLISHAVTTRLGDTLFAIKPSYAAIIMSLLLAGTQGLQLALLAPGWLHEAVSVETQRPRSVRAAPESRAVVAPGVTSPNSRCADGLVSDAAVIGVTLSRASP
jgi:hypothetical protein